jgi:hypothetical protein
MSTIELSTLLDSILVLLTEAYAGPPDPKATWFIDNEPDSGVLGVLSKVTAAEASISVDGSGKSGSTIASNAEHLRWTLENMNATIRGTPWNPKWAESWELIDTEEEEWDLLRQSLRTEFETLRGLLKQQTQLPGEYLTGTLALIPHAAFHLGLIRQMVERVRV